MEVINITLSIDLQKDFDLISKDNAQQQRIIDNQKVDINYLMSKVARLELDKKRLQEHLKKREVNELYENIV